MSMMSIWIRFVFINSILFISSHCFSAEIPIVRIYSTGSFAKVIKNNIQKGFEAKNNCKLEFLNLHGVASIIADIKKSRNPQGDMILGLSYDACKGEKMRSYFADLEIPNSLKLPIEWKNNKFLPMQIGFLSFVYDNRRIKQPLTSFDDLLQLKGKIIISDPRMSIIGQSLLFWVKNNYNIKASSFWQLLQPKILTITHSWSDAYSLFLKGEAPVVLSYTTSELYHKLKAKQNHIVASRFKEGQYLEILVGAILKNTSKLELSNKLLLETLSEQFQRAVMSESWGYPVVHIQDMPKEFMSYPKFSKPIINENFDNFRQFILEEWLEAMSA